MYFVQLFSWVLGLNPDKKCGEKRGLNPRQPESKSLRNFVAYIQLRLEGGKSCYLFNLSYTWVTQHIDNSILFKYIDYFNIKKFTI